jgi:hypothetical protein
MRFELQRVRYIPTELSPGVLYVSKEFDIAAHLCACGCGSKIKTPLGPCEWSIEQTAKGPSLTPSIGNWQEPCQSHYWIYRGEIKWADRWSPEQIAAGRRREEQRRAAYFDARGQKREGPFRRFSRWVAGLFRQR